LFTRANAASQQQHDGGLLTSFNRTGWQEDYNAESGKGSIRAPQAAMP